MRHNLWVSACASVSVLQCLRAAIGTPLCSPDAAASTLLSLASPSSACNARQPAATPCSYLYAGSRHLKEQLKQILKMQNDTLRAATDEAMGDLHVLTDDIAEAAVIIVRERWTPTNTLYCCRCLEAMSAVGRGVWLVSESWIVECVKQSYMVRLADFEIQDVRPTKTAVCLNGALKKAREVSMPTRYSLPAPVCILAPPCHGRRAMPGASDCWRDTQLKCPLRSS